MDSAEKLLADLIALPSVNPAFLPEGDPRAGEQKVAELLLSLAGSNGLAVELQEVLPGRSNLIARMLPAERARRRVVLAPHMDTVGGAEISEALFTPRNRNGRMHGRGACDTKGSIAAMLSALLNVATSGERPRQTEIVFAGLVDEENAQRGSRAFAARKEKAHLAIVGEPTALKLVTAHKGDLWLKVVTKGKAAHGSKPELGVNAVHQMARVVDLLETKYARALRKKKHPVLGSPTINVGAIRGGMQPNIVPDYCEISIDRRTIPGETEKSTRQEIAALIREAGLEAEILNEKLLACLPMETDANLELVSSFSKLLGQTRAVGVDFFCDASILSDGGIPSVVFGPGDIAQAHTADEWISLEELRRATDLLTSFLRSLP